MNVIILGAPGVGKGTNAKYFADRQGIAHISTGDMFRQAIKDQTDLGKKAQEYLDQGQLVPDEITTAMVQERLAQTDTKNGFLLDGYPRNLEQGKALDKFAKIDLVINLTAPTKKIVERISGRRVCSNCSTTYHLVHAAPKKENICDHCGAELIKRTDETPDIVQQRLKVYETLTTPLVDFYRNEDLLYEIDVSSNLEDWPKIEQQYDELLKELNAHGRENS